MRSSTRIVVAVAGLALITVPTSQWGATGQTRQVKPQTPRSDNPQISVLEVRLPVTVKNQDTFVPGLAVDNFEVYEDGKRQKIEKFEAQNAFPLRIAALMDTSNSVKLKLRFEQDAAEDFFSSVARYQKGDQVLFATFDSDVEIHQDFTDNLEPLIRTMRKVKASGYTRLYDAVCQVIEQKLSSAKGSNGARRIMVILSDGEDTASGRSLKDALELAQRHDVTIFGISTRNFSGTGAGAVASSDDKNLRRLCEETGGQLFLPSQKLELYQAFGKIAEDLRHEYFIIYNPQNQEKSGKQRSIKIKLMRAEGRAYHKQGYTY
ncbi:MAG TPA: VWA domain-containing protein [Blastocatellia bacterium]|nr:VWA domain-containing protein [Blastocatellia bacterium]